MIFFREMSKHLSRMRATAWPVGHAIFAVLGLMVGIGFALAEQPSWRAVSPGDPGAVLVGDGIAGYAWRTADRVPQPKKRPAVVTPEGGISFGETAAPSPAAARRATLKWSEMSQKEIDAMTGLLRTLGKKPPVMIVCKDPMCEDLALNLDNVFESAKWKSEIVIGTQFGVPAGVTVSSKWLAEAFNGTTGNRYAAKVDDGKSADGEYILIGPKPR